MAELVHHSATTQNSVIAYRHVACKGGAVGKNSVITNYAIVGHMHISHEQVVATDPGFALILHGAPVNSATFPNGVVVADNQCGWFASVLFILTLFTNAGKLENPIVPANNRRSFHHYMRKDRRLLAGTIGFSSQ